MSLLPGLNPLPPGPLWRYVPPCQQFVKKIFRQKNASKKRSHPFQILYPYYLYEKQIVMMKEYKRTSRQLSQETKLKISMALKGRRRQKDVCKRISKGLRKYWSSVEEGE